MTKDRQILFFGELPPRNIHGIAYSNHINLTFLRTCFLVDIVEETNSLVDHDNISVIKFIKLVKGITKVIQKSISCKYAYFYLTFSLTSLGGLKTLSAILGYKFFNRGKVVLHVHRGDFFSRFMRRFLNRIITKLVFRLTDEVIVLSASQKFQFESKFNKRFCILSNTIEIELEPILRNRKNRDFIYISNYLLDKGIVDLLEVFSKLTSQNKEITLSAYGEFSDIALKELILSFQSDKITINGPIQGIEKFSRIADSDCLILPSWNEGQPIVLIEAMSVGTPVIASDTGLVPELLGTDYPLLMIPGDRESLKEKLILFIGLKDTLELSARLYDNYATSYSHKTHKDNLYRIFC
jgi:glycosyltransferase involved in cell wall biosynthesis